MRYIDVTLSLQPGMRGVEFETAKQLHIDGWNAKTLHLYSHAGTHMDAPVHFEVNEGTIDQYPASRFFSTCYVVDLTGIEPNTEIGIKDLGEIKDIVQRGEGLIFRTGWSKFVNDPLYRTGVPGFSEELALWCAEKGITTVGVEPPSVADLTDMQLTRRVHEILLDAGIIIVEGLTNLEQITKQKVNFVALPLKVKEGDGAPCRAIVIEE